MRPKRTSMIGPQVRGGLGKPNPRNPRSILRYYRCLLLIWKRQLTPTTSAAPKNTGPGARIMPPRLFPAASHHHHTLRNTVTALAANPPHARTTRTRRTASSQRTSGPFRRTSTPTRFASPRATSRTATYPNASPKNSESTANVATDFPQCLMKNLHRSMKEPNL